MHYEHLVVITESYTKTNYYKAKHVSNVIYLGVFQTVITNQ